jgi:hypothetical protein
VITVLCGLLGALGGLVVTFVPKLVESPSRAWVAVGFVVVLVVGALSAIKDQLDNAKQVETLLREVTGAGGFPMVIVRGLLPIAGQVVDGKGVAQFLLMSGTEIPVFDSQVRILKHVPPGQGVRGTDSVVLPAIDVPVVHKGAAPRELFSAGVLELDAPNIFSAVVFSRAGTFSQFMVAVWKDGAWHSDCEVKRLDMKGDTQRETTLKRMRQDLRELLPAPWQT